MKTRTARKMRVTPPEVDFSVTLCRGDPRSGNKGPEAISQAIYAHWPKQKTIHMYVKTFWFGRTCFEQQNSWLKWDGLDSSHWHFSMWLIYVCNELDIPPITFFFTCKKIFTDVKTTVCIIFQILEIYFLVYHFEGPSNEGESALSEHMQRYLG